MYIPGLESALQANDVLVTAVEEYLEAFDGDLPGHVVEDELGVLLGDLGLHGLEPVLGLQLGLADLHLAAFEGLAVLAEGDVDGVADGAKLLLAIGPDVEELVTTLKHQDLRGGGGAGAGAGAGGGRQQVQA